MFSLELINSSAVVISKNILIAVDGDLPIKEVHVEVKINRIKFLSPFALNFQQAPLLLAITSISFRYQNKYLNINGKILMIKKMQISNCLKKTTKERDVLTGSNLAITISPGRKNHNLSFQY